MRIFEIVAENVCHQLCHAVFPKVDGQARMMKDGVFTIELVDGTMAKVVFSRRDEISVTNEIKQVTRHTYWNPEDTHYEIAEFVLAAIESTKH